MDYFWGARTAMTAARKVSRKGRKGRKDKSRHQNGALAVFSEMVRQSGFASSFRAEGHLGIPSKTAANCGLKNAVALEPDAYRIFCGLSVLSAKPSEPFWRNYLLPAAYQSTAK